MIKSFTCSEALIQLLIRFTGIQLSSACTTSSFRLGSQKPLEASEALCCCAQPNCKPCFMTQPCSGTAFCCLDKSFMIEPACHAHAMDICLQHLSKNQSVWTGGFWADDIKERPFARASMPSEQDSNAWAILSTPCIFQMRSKDASAAFN